MRQPFVYLRKSRVMRDQEIISPEMQLAAATEYAARFDDTDLLVLTDLNKSGRKGRKERPGFDALLTAIEEGRCSAVYSYSLSRLSRSVRDLMALADLCRSANVPIRLARDTDPDPTTATGRAVLALLGVMAQLEADLAQERALDAVEARRARGDKMGGPVFERHELVIDAYNEAGSATGAARLLTSRGIPTLRGKAVWYPSAVTVILQRAAPHLLPPVRQAGVKKAAPFTFYRLLRCWCGTTLTGWRRTWGYVSYRCTRGRLIPGHGKTHIAESIVLEWARGEMDRLTPPTDLVALARSNETERRSLEERRDRVRVAWIDGLYASESEMLAEKAELDDAIMRLDLAGRAVRVPAFEWDHEPRDLNLALRSLWGHVELGRDLRPVRAEWLVPSSWLRTVEPEPGLPAALPA